MAEDAPDTPAAAAGSSIYPSELYTQSSAAFGTADIVLLSEDGIRFPCHKLFLSASSRVFNDMLGLGKAGEDKSEVQCAATAEELNDILIYIYPVHSPSVEGYERARLVNLARVSGKLGIARATDRYCSALTRKAWLTDHGIELYILAIQVNHESLKRYSLPAAAADPTLLSNFSRHCEALGSREAAKLVEVAHARKHFLSPAEVHDNYTVAAQFFSSRNRSYGGESESSLKYFDMLTPERQNQAIAEQVSKAFE